MNSSEEKKQFLSELIRAMRADGNESEEEQLMIEATLEYLGITETEYAVLKADPDCYTPPRIDTERIVQFYQLAVLVKADGEINNREKAYLHWIGLKMGFRHEAIKGVIIGMGESPSGMLDASEVIKIFQVFHN